LSYPASSKRPVVEHIGKETDVHLGETTLENVNFAAMLWVLFQAKVFPHYFLRMKGIVIVTTMES
jgi:hypothetical protein